MARVPFLPGIRRCAQRRLFVLRAFSFRAWRSVAQGLYAFVGHLRLARSEVVLHFVGRHPGIVEESKKLKVFLLGDRIILVSVALSACHGCAHPHLHGGVHPVDYGNVSELFIVRSSLIVGERVAVKGGCGELIIRWIWKEVAGQLIDGKVIIGLIGIQC